MVNRADPEQFIAHRSSSGEGYLSPFSDARTALALCLATTLALVFFNRFPQLDIWVSQWFFDQFDCPNGQTDIVCGRFHAAFDPGLITIRNMLHYTPVVAGVVLIGAALATGYSGQTRLRLFARGAWTAVAALLLSGLVIVNVILKEMSGRPRPVDTDLFGGAFPFVEAGRFVDYCDTNCSFVSGEAATAMWLVCLVPLASIRWRPLALAITLSLALLAIVLRIAFGGHYLSDTVIGALLTLTTFSILATLARRIGWYEVKP